jgi:hypothetical protein
MQEIPQQPNYTTHTSQVEPTDIELIPTVDFSETEESTKSDNSDDRLSSKEVSGRGKKRTGPRTTKVPTMKRISR